MRPYGSPSVPTCAGYAGRNLSSKYGYVPARYERSNWDLDSVNAQGRAPYRGKAGRKPVRLVHNVILSMPKGTPPEKLLLASRDFAREQFALKHRYALAMHTDQDHPHVHLLHCR